MVLGQCYVSELFFPREPVVKHLSSACHWVTYFSPTDTVITTSMPPVIF